VSLDRVGTWAATFAARRFADFPAGHALRSSNVGVAAEEATELQRRCGRLQADQASFQQANQELQRKLQAKESELGSVQEQLQRMRRPWWRRWK
jgi:hypothetical protein